MIWIIDRIENNTAVCEIEANKFIDIPLSALPDGVKEGDAISLCVNKNETQKRKDNINNLMNNLFKD